MEEISSQNSKRKAKKLPIAITKQEYEELIAVTKSPKQRLAFYLGFNSGLRVSEVVKLESRDIDIPGSKIFIREGKGKKDRIAPMPKGFQKKYQDMLPLGIGSRALQKAFKVAAKRSGLLEIKPTAHFHSLRHGFATYFLEQGGNIQLLKVLMGHTNISTTDIYNQLNPKVALDAYKELF
jgi:site-specific recombinase XerD